SKHEIRSSKTETISKSKNAVVQTAAVSDLEDSDLFRDSDFEIRGSDAPPPQPSPGVPEEGEEGGASDVQAVRFGRAFGVIALIVGVICAQLLVEHSKKPVFLFLLNAYGYFTPGIATMFLLGIMWKRTTSAGALAAGILTIPMSVAMEWEFPKLAFQNRTGIVFWTCMIVCALVSLGTAPESAEKLKGLIWTKESLHLPPEQRRKYRGLRRPTIWWAVITAVVIFFYIRFA
ncbi:MAG TPA: hypothetical protein VG722_10570, partial [Tepidisphaeraceae bacterium]|nr:hypothetical protein [Tepidisphaeraceae bacterium]